MATDPVAGWWPRMRDWLHGRRPGSPTSADKASWRDAPEAATDRRDPGRDPLKVFVMDTDDWTFVTPAQGDAHAFWVEVHCAWYASRTAAGSFSRERTRQELRDELAQARRGMRRKVEDEVRRRAREFPPYRPADAEEEIGSAVRSCLSNGAVQCVTSLRFSLTEDVRQQLEPFWTERMARDMETERSRRMAEQMHELQGAWSRVLSGGLAELEDALRGDTAWMAPWALTLAEQPQGVARVMEQMLNHRMGAARKMLEALSRAVQRHEQVGAYDVVVEHDTALRNMMLALGVRLPELPQDSLLREGS